MEQRDDEFVALVMVKNESRYSALRLSGLVPLQRRDEGIGNGRIRPPPMSDVRARSGEAVVRLRHDAPS